MSLSLTEAVREAPRATALVWEGRQISFAELADRALALKLPASAGVALVAEPTLDAVAALHACIAAGVPVIPLHPRWTERERLAAARGAEVWNPEPLGTRNSTLPTVPDDERCLAVLHTAGSTGTPKGVSLSRRAFAAAAQASAKNLGWRPEDRWLLCLSWAHVGGLSVLTRCLAARSTVVLLPGAHFDPEAVHASLTRDRVTLLSVVPTQLQQLLRSPPPPHLRAVLLGGAPASSALVAAAREAGWPVRLTYGSSEACSQVATQREPGDPGCGRPLDGTEVRIVDGVIRLRGPTLMSGYVGRAESGLDADGWFTTGDLGRLDERGCLHVLGRADEVIITGGEKVHPREVEAVLESFPGVAAACVYGVPSARWGEELRAVLVQRSGGFDEGALTAHLAQHLAVWKRPRTVQRLDALPMTPTGKVDRLALRELSRSPR